MDWLMTLMDGDIAVSYRAADDTWIADAAEAQRYSDAEKASIEVPVDMGLPRWQWTPAPVN